ncbi:hypothetical protein [Nesterenkonia alkaliphila]|uniref:Peptidase n=1 Tax=Nesterenkonia alkaliphila TaxID=1463631 RepID=A0A7K1UMI1_9MICC|nr:hypothetical protein [Nesterenkonia alkaliphila]MVT27502.1 hypothetical protein [Nesterenkonia alkaliphila]
MTQSRARRTLAGLGVSAALAAMLAPPTAAQEAPPNGGTDVLQGERIEGGTHQDNGPELHPGNYYLSTFESETQYFRVQRTIEDSTLHVGLTTYDEQGEFTDDAEIELSTFDGDTCESQRLDWETTGAGNLLRGAQIRATAPQDEEDFRAVPACGSAEELLLLLSSPNGELVGEDYELVIAEEPDPLNGDELRTNFEDSSEHWGSEGLVWHEMPRQRGEANPLEPGSSLHSAPRLDPGTTYDAALEPGDVHVYRVSADWNQQIQAEVFFPEPNSALSEELGRWAEAEVSIISPFRGATTPSGSRAPDEQNLSNWIHDTQATTLRAQSYPITWPTRFAGTQTGSNARHATMPGEYYVVVAMDPPSEDDEASDSFQVPYRLTADVFDAFDETVPEYDVSPVTPAGSSGDQDPSGEENGEEDAVGADQSGGISTGQGMALSLGAFGLLLAGAGGLFLVRVMRQQP